MEEKWRASKEKTFKSQEAKIQGLDGEEVREKQNEDYLERLWGFGDDQSLGLPQTGQALSN